MAEFNPKSFGSVSADKTRSQNDLINDLKAFLDSTEYKFYAKANLIEFDIPRAFLVALAQCDKAGFLELKTKLKVAFENFNVFHNIVEHDEILAQLGKLLEMLNQGSLVSKEAIEQKVVSLQGLIATLDSNGSLDDLALVDWWYGLADKHSDLDDVKASYQAKIDEIVQDIEIYPSLEKKLYDFVDALESPTAYTFKARKHTKHQQTH